MKLSIIIPVYNSSKILNKLVEEINKHLAQELKNNYEIIFINDFSQDTSWTTILELSNRYQEIKGINLEKNIGQHGSIFVGLKFSTGEKIVIMDDDLQHPPSSILSIYHKLNSYDVC